MVEPNKSRGRADVWRPWVAAGRRFAPEWLDRLNDFIGGAARRLREWVLAEAAGSVDVAGFVEVREERERSDRIVVRVERITGPRLNEKLERVRVSVRKGTAPAVGTFVEFKSRLSPPLAPLRPGGYDFA